ncbi:hypothetical protein D3C84_1100840 [compost metagenome]
MRIHVLPVHEDDILHPACNIQSPVPHKPKIAGVQPSILGDQRGVDIGLPIVTLRHIAAPNMNEANVLIFYLLAV